MDYTIDIEENIEEYIIPKLLLQPLVENAIVHGIRNKRGNGHVSIEGRQKEDKIVFYVSDDGRGMTTEELAKLKKRLKEEGASELLTNCKQLKMRATDGKMRLTDVASTEQLLRIIQSIPSPKAEPFKRWLAQVGRERIEETIDPEQAIDRALETYQKKGYDADWIHQRILSIRVRNELTAEWQARGVEQGREYAILTDEITKAWSGMTTRQYKNLKGLKKENLRDNMSTLEIVLNMLAETTTTELSKAHRPEGFEESRIVARRGGKVAGDARRAIEADTGRPAVTAENAAQLNAVVTDVIEGVAEADKPNGDEK